MFSFFNHLFHQVICLPRLIIQTYIQSCKIVHLFGLQETFLKSYVCKWTENNCKISRSPEGIPQKIGVRIIMHCPKNILNLRIKTTEPVTVGADARVCGFWAGWKLMPDISRMYTYCTLYTVFRWVSYARDKLGFCARRYRIFLA